MTYISLPKVQLPIYSILCFLSTVRELGTAIIIIDYNHPDMQITYHSCLHELESKHSPAHHQFHPRPCQTSSKSCIVSRASFFLITLWRKSSIVFCNAWREVDFYCNLRWHVASLHFSCVSVLLYHALQWFLPRNLVNCTRKSCRQSSCSFIPSEYMRWNTTDQQTWIAGTLVGGAHFKLFRFKMTVNFSM